MPVYQLLQLCAVQTYAVLTLVTHTICFLLQVEAFSGKAPAFLFLLEHKMFCYCSFNNPNSNKIPWLKDKYFETISKAVCVKQYLKRRTKTSNLKNK